MYTATMSYEFDSRFTEEACRLWEQEVMRLAKKQPGFIRMQFLLSGDSALAIGTWEDKKYAQDFMQTGVFIRLMEKMGNMVAGRPVPRVWDLRYFEEK